MASLIDPSQPNEGDPTTASVRANFQTAASEITALQSTTLPDAPMTGAMYARQSGGWAPMAPDAPANGVLYGRQSAGWAPVPPPGIGEAPGGGVLYGRRSSGWTAVPISADAPSNGTLYARQNNGWTAVPPAGIGEAPSDSGTYARRNAVWQKAAEEAPQNGGYYARRNAAWVQVPPEAPTGVGVYYGRVNSSWQPIPGEAPLNTTLYARSNGAWVAVPPAGIGDAPSDSKTYSRGSGAWVAAPPEAPSDSAYYARRNGAWAKATPEAPLNTTLYGRLNGAWAAAPPEAPQDGGYYARRNAGWTKATEEAPLNTTLYGRSNGAWVAVPPAGIGEAPATYPYARYGGAWTALAALYPQMFGAVAGGPDATAALQAGLDAAYNLGLDFVVAGGVYSTTGVNVYSGMRVHFAQGGSFKMTATGACIRTLPAPGSPPGQTANITVDKPLIDMGNHAGAAIVLEGCRYSVVRQPRLLNLPLPGTFPWSDRFEHAGTLPNAGIILKGMPPGGDDGASNPGTGCYYNTVEIIDIQPSAGARKCYGAWLGTSSGGTSQRANYNQFYGGQISGCTFAVYVSTGGDNTFEAIDTSSNDTAYALGLDGETLVVHRTRIIKPYAESCTVGLHLGLGSDRPIVEGAGSWAGTTTPVVEDPGNDNLGSLYVNFDTPAGAAQLFPYDMLGPSSSLFHVVAGAGGGPTGSRDGGLAAASYAAAGHLVLGRINGIPSSKAPVASGDLIGHIIGSGWDGGAMSINMSPGASPGIVFLALEDWAPAAHGAQVTLQAIGLGSTTVVNEVRVRADGTLFQHGAGFWGGTAPAAKPGAAGNVATSAAGNGAQAYLNTRYTGGVGATGYSNGDVVAVLKAYGMIAA